MNSSSVRYAALAVLLLSANVLQAQRDTTRTGADSLRSRGLGTVTVMGRVDDLTGIARTASEGHVGMADLRLRPITREGELLETVPGMIVTQHSGDGKANQYFIRGFNLDHGTDFQTRLEGMPLNMPSHAHGQGYTDLNFLIPELVDYIDYKLGVYHPELGDFGSAGGAEFHLLQRLDRPLVTTSAGAYGLARVAAATSQRAAGGDLLLGGELKTYDGPWAIPEDIRKVSTMARWSRSRGSSRLSVLALAYHNEWNASDQIPQRAVRDGLIGRFGQIDSTDGGRAARYSLSASLQRASGSALQRAQFFAVWSELDLFSNFTYFLDNAPSGDQFNQHERRLILGGNASHATEAQALGAPHTLTVGVQARTDVIRPVGLYRTNGRGRVGTVRQDDVTETGAGVFVSAESRWSPRVRTSLGVRADGNAFEVSSDIPENSGTHTAAIVSPKASVVITPGHGAELYLSGGLGFHSNDARGTTITVDPVTRQPVDQVDPLVRSRGAEIGYRQTVGGLRSTLTAWFLQLDSELLFIGDGGATEPSDKSRRSGVTWANFWRPAQSLSIDADVSLARAHFVGVDPAEDHIPGALENVVAAGITWSGRERGPFASVRVRHFGSYPLIEDNSVRATATTLMNAEIGFRVGAMRWTLAALNLLDERASDIQYYYASRLPGEGEAGVDDVHFHPVEPRRLSLSLSWGL